MFPIVIYTGHATLSPLRTVSFVSSEAMITGHTVDPSGKIPFHFVSSTLIWNFIAHLYLPPPIRCIHLVVNSRSSRLISVNLLCTPLDTILERGVADKFLDDLDGITVPYLYDLFQYLPVLCNNISFDMKRCTLPRWTLRDPVDAVEKRLFALRG